MTDDTVDPKDSILISTKKVLGIDADYHAFDDDIMMHINSVFGTLQQLGLGPVEGFEIDDETATWSDFLSGNVTYNPVRTYVYLRVRLLFDPPATSFAITAMENQIKELEWRLNVRREEVDHPWVEPIPEPEMW